CAFRAEYKSAKIEPDGFARGRACPLKLACSRNDADVKDKIFDVAVTIFLHAAGVGRNPTAKSGKLDAVRLMAHRDLVLPQFGHDVPSYCARLNTSHHVCTVDPKDSIHPPHIDRENRPMFPLVTAKGVGDVCSAAIRNQSDVVRLCRLDERRHLSLRFRIDDQIGDAPEPSVLNRIHLFLSMAVTMPQPNFTVRIDLIGAKELLKSIEKFAFDVWLGNRRRVPWRVYIPRVDVALQYFPYPGQKARQFFSAKLIPGTHDDD